MTTRRGSAEVVAADFPRLHARTQGFTLGVPRDVTAAGDRVLFLRSAGDRPEQSLWSMEADGSERLLADPRVVMPAGDLSVLPPEERARRERSRERASGIVGFAVDDAGRHAVFTLAGKLLVCEVATGVTQQLPVDGPVFDPRPNPTGTHIAYVEDDALWVVRLDGTNAPRLVAHSRDPEVTWGLAEFVAGEEMGRTRGYWWAPAGDRLLAARVDTHRVTQWWISAPVDPHVRPTATRYPAAGTANAEVTLALVDLAGNHVSVEWNRRGTPYLAEVAWSAAGPPTLVVQSRDQQHVAILQLDPDTGATWPIAEEHGEPWLELIPGNPTWTTDGRLVRVVDFDDTRKVAIGEEIRGHDDLMVASLVGVDDEEVIVTAHVRSRPWCTVVVGLGPDGRTSWRSDPEGVATARLGGTPSRLMRSQRHPDSARTIVTVDDRQLASNAVDAPALPVAVDAPVGGAEQPVSRLLRPDWWTPDHGPLPVLVSSYGGPHARVVMGDGGRHLSHAWFAANGFVVLMVDGPGSPGHSLTWEAAVAGDLAGPPLTGQVEALERASDAHPDLLDRSRVAIRGWSFGGYLAALAVLRRPEVFHAAVAGAPVTDWTLYDTHYTERYLGDPDIQPEVYAQSSLVDEAADLTRPLLLIHGLADDNVVAAHTLRLSRALLEAGRPHEVLPLSGVTHFTPSEDINANLLRHELDFLHRSLQVDRTSRE